MAFFFIMGTQSFINPIQGHEHLTVYCPNCHNVSVHPQKRLMMFTFCFIPIIPLSNQKEMNCAICNWHQNLQPGELEQIEAAQRGQQGPPGLPPGQYPPYRPPGAQ